MNKTIGQVAYEAWVAASNLKGWADSWDKLEEEKRVKYEAVGAACVLHHLANIPAALPPLHPTTTVLSDAPRDKVCDHCDGAGFIVRMGISRDCTTCQGKGYIQ